MISRILLSMLALAVVLTCSTAYSQSECPKEEIIIFGSTYGYTTAIYGKKGKECTKTPSATIVFHPKKVTKVGCAKAPNCDSCATPQPKAAAKGNFVYSGRQIFLDTTDGVSKLESLKFAMVEGDKSDTHYAIFEVSVAYLLEGNDPTYFTCPMALQLPGDPGIPDPLSAANKTVEGETHLVVTDPKTDKEKSFKIIDARGNHGVVKTRLLRTLEKNPVPPAPKQPAAKAKPSPAKAKSAPRPARRSRVTPVEDR